MATRNSSSKPSQEFKRESSKENGVKIRKVFINNQKAESRQKSRTRVNPNSDNKSTVSPKIIKQACKY